MSGALPGYARHVAGSGWEEVIPGEVGYAFYPYLRMALTIGALHDAVDDARRSCGVDGDEEVVAVRDAVAGPIELLGVYRKHFVDLLIDVLVAFSIAVVLPKLEEPSGQHLGWAVPV